MEPDVIADVSATLIEVLQTGLDAAGLLPAVDVSLHNLVDALPADRLVLAVFLYDVVEDPSARNAPRRITSGQREAPPMALILRYLIAPIAGGDTPRVSEQLMLGYALRTLYDNAIMHGNQLQGALASTSESLKVTLTPITLEDRTRIWQSVQKPYRISITYEVRVVRISSQRSRPAPPVRERDLDAMRPDS